MLIFSGELYDAKAGKIVAFDIKAKPEAEAIAKIREKYKKRNKKILAVRLLYVDFATNR